MAWLVGSKSRPLPPADAPQRSAGDADILAASLRDIKRALVRDGSASGVAEAIPVMTSPEFPAPQSDLDMLHRFASENPIYCNSCESVLAGIPCITYDGDINRYWLGSILHASSRAPFSPTWIASAYVLARHARDLGYCQVIDVGSGDGRIAFCSVVAGMDAYSIELDDELVRLQERLAGIAKFEPYCSDAAAFDYDVLNLAHFAVFVGGLAQMGGDALADAVMHGLGGAISHGGAGWVFAGTRSPKYAPDPAGMYGWGRTMETKRLVPIRTVDLPTAWTLDQDDDTPYVFARSA